MMNLEKRKNHTVRKRIKAGMLLATTFFCLVSPLSAAHSVFAAEGGGPSISIEKPNGWKQGDTNVSILVDSSQTKIAKIEAKAGPDGKWKDVTASKSITVNGNQTVYVRVTDTEGNVYKQNRSIRCYDVEKPTVSASLTDGVLTIQGNDANSGIASVTINGTNYTDLENGKLRLRLTQNDFTKQTFEITAKDNAGNTSDKYTIRNPYYDWAVKQAQNNDGSAGDLSTTSTAETGDGGIQSPLPQDAEASEPTDAKGTVDDRTVTGTEKELAETNIENELAENGEDAQTITQTGSEGSKEFYTISTKSGKIFYLIIDNSKSQDNVYFLTEVSEKDLMNFTLSDTVTLPNADTTAAEQAQEQEVAEESVDPAEGESADASEEEAEEEEAQMPEDKSPAGSYILIGLVVVGIFGGAYYFKIYKPKQEGDDGEDEYEEEDVKEEPTEPDDDEDADEEKPAESDEGEEPTESDDGEDMDEDVLEDDDEEDEE